MKSNEYDEYFEYVRVEYLPNGDTARYDIRRELAERLESEVRKAKADAWQEGRMAVWELYNSRGMHHFRSMTNPYAAGQGDGDMP